MTQIDPQEQERFRVECLRAVVRAQLALEQAKNARERSDELVANLRAQLRALD